MLNGFVRFGLMISTVSRGGRAYHTLVRPSERFDFRRE
jgi:hypothetical protein